MTYDVAPHVHSRAVHDEVMILDARTDAYLGLNPTAATIWQALAAGRTATAAVEALAAGFDVPAAVARADVASFVEDLVARGLLVRTAA